MHGVFTALINGLHEKGEGGVLWVRGETCAYCFPDDFGNDEFASGLKMMLSKPQSRTLFLVVNETDGRLDVVGYGQGVRELREGSGGGIGESRRRRGRECHREVAPHVPITTAPDGWSATTSRGVRVARRPRAWSSESQADAPVRDRQDDARPRGLERSTMHRHARPSTDEATLLGKGASTAVAARSASDQLARRDDVVRLRRVPVRVPAGLGTVDDEGGLDRALVRRVRTTWSTVVEEHVGDLQDLRSRPILPSARSTGGCRRRPSTNDRVAACAGSLTGDGSCLTSRHAKTDDGEARRVRPRTLRGLVEEDGLEDLGVERATAAGGDGRATIRLRSSLTTGTRTRSAASRAPSRRGTGSRTAHAG